MPNELDGASGLEDTSLRDSLSSAMTAEPAAEPAPAPAPEPAVAAPEPAADTGEGNRDELGRFKTKDGDPAAPAVDPAAAPAVDPAAQAPDAAAQAAADAQAAAAAGEGATENITPPPGWSPSAKAEFAGLSDAVKAAVAKREVEVDQGFAKLRDYKALDPYVEMAQQSQTTLPEALDRYVAAERLLEQDPRQGILWMCQTYGVDPVTLGGQPAQQAAPVGQQPGQAAGQPAAQPALQPAPQPNVSLEPLMQEFNSLKEMVIGERTAKTTSEIDAFYNDTVNHPYAENVSDQMADLIKSGMAGDLQQAYDMACWNNPEIRGLLIKKQADDVAANQAAEAKRAADQARLAGSSITGGAAETPGSTPETNLRATLEQQMAGGRA